MAVHDTSRLPKWAQTLIRNQQEEIERLTETVDTLTGGPLAEQRDSPLQVRHSPLHPPIHVRATGDLKINLERGTIRVRLLAIGLVELQTDMQPLVFYPRAANTVYVGLEGPGA